MLKRTPPPITLLLFLATILFGCSAERSPSAVVHDADVESPQVDGGVPPDESGEWGELDQRTCDRLGEQVARGVEDLELVGAAIGVAYAQEQLLCVRAAGMAQKETLTAWTPERSFRIGSVTKTFTAALVFLLEADGALSLDDPLEQWAPGYYDGLGLTIRHLLSNTSGIVSYNWVGSFDDTRRWEPAELAQWAVDNQPTLEFEPGSQWAYSNTNFVLLGLIIEAAGGDSYEAQVEARLTGPLGLRDTYIAGSGDANSAIVDCYDVDGTNLTGRADPSFGWAAGAAVSTPSDLARWAAALYGGDVLSADALTRMTTPTVLTDGTVTEYGLGAFLEIDGADAIFGHTGGIGAYLTYMYYWRADGIALVAMSNTFQTNLRELSAYGWSVPLDFEHP